MQVGRGEQDGGWLQSQKESYHMLQQYRCWSQVLKKPESETKLSGAEFIAPLFTKYWSNPVSFDR